MDRGDGAGKAREGPASPPGDRGHPQGRDRHGEAGQEAVDTRQRVLLGAV